MHKIIKLGLSSLLFFLTNTLSFAQCFEIESILVDACEGTSNAEGQNEMVRFKVGNTAINTNQMSVTWPSNTWGGLIQNTTTAQKVAQINAEIIASGGCGTVLEPTNGILPANATVILVTSHLFDVALNPFGAMNDTVYIIFQNSVVTGGHFGNYGTPALRTLTISFGNACTDTVTYDRSLLIDENGQSAAGNGAAVNFAPNGSATYVNNGCSAPVANTIFEITQYPESTCASSTIQLGSEVSGYQTIQWSSPDGTFSNPNALTTNFTVNANATGSVSITLTMTNMCDAVVTQTITIPLQQQTVPVFNNLPTQICNNSNLPVLPTVSTNGISGTWSPAIIQPNYQGNYVFTPNAGQCASVLTKQIEVSNFDVQLISECDGESLVIKANGTDEVINYIWKNQAGVVIATGQNEFNVSEYVKTLPLAVLPLQITVEASLGNCEVIKTIEITSLLCSIQKGVSPNADGKNDFFDLRTLNVLQINIFNRYGTKVYNKALYRDEWFGQNSNGDLLPVGTYFYEIETIDKPITGWIELMY